MATEPRPVTRRERAAWALCSRLLVWLFKRALDRRDWHEANHVVLQLRVGHSNHGGRLALPCRLPPESYDRLVFAPPSVPGQWPNDGDEGAFRA